MKPYTSPEAIEIGVADEVILGGKPENLWDASTQEFTMSAFSIVDVDE